MRTFVSLGPLDRWPDEIDVLALDLDQRERSVDEARVAARSAASQVRARLFLKIDSTLRGPLEGLVAGALEGSGLAIAVVAPAFPEQGRLLVNGRLVLRDQAAPGASLADRLGAAVVAAEEARTPDRLEAAIQGCAGTRVVIDTDGAACLDSLAALWPRHPDWLLVGSAGLARRLAPQAVAPSALPADQATVVIVAGSPAAATHTQLARLQDLSGLRILTAGPTDVRDDGTRAAALADQVKQLSASMRPAGLVLVGGQTARHVCQRLDVRGLRIRGELEPGIAHGMLIGGVWNGLPVISKAGGFGGPNALLDAVRAFGVSSVTGEGT